MAKGDHIYVHSGPGSITHHGIDCGDGTVIHYRSKTKNGGKIAQTSYNEFARQKKVYVKSYPYKYSPDEIVRRAKRRLNEPQYNLFSNNCEHFATDCTTGEPDSQQARNGWGAFNVGTGIGRMTFAGLASVARTVPAAGLLGAMGFTTTVGLSPVIIAGGAIAAGVVGAGAAFTAFQKFSESEDEELT